MRTSSPNEILSYLHKTLLSAKSLSEKALEFEGNQFAWKWHMETCTPYITMEGPSQDKTFMLCIRGVILLRASLWVFLLRVQLIAHSPLRSPIISHYFSLLHPSDRLGMHGAWKQPDILSSCPTWPAFLALWCHTLWHHTLGTSHIPTDYGKLHWHCIDRLYAATILLQLCIMVLLCRKREGMW